VELTEQSAAPAADVTGAVKARAADTEARFTLTSTHTGEWKVYAILSGCAVADSAGDGDDSDEDKVELLKVVTITVDFPLIVPEGVVLNTGGGLTLADGAALTVNGKLSAADGSLAVRGAAVAGGSGVISLSGGGSLFSIGAGQTLRLTDITLKGVAGMRLL